MTYTAVSGGEEAIRAAEGLERAVGGPSLAPEAVEAGLRYAVDRVMGEAGLYAPKLAALAMVEAQGDLDEAAFLLRAYRSTLPRVGYTRTLNPDGMRLIRRVSSTHQDVPGGQILGPTRDYSRRLLGRNGPERASANGGVKAGAKGEGRLPKVTDLLREARLVDSPQPAEGGEPFDVTREALRLPAPRSARLQALARGEGGAMGSLAHGLLRGFGRAHPVVTELRVGYLPLLFEHPLVGGAVEFGEVLCTEAEAVSSHAYYKSGGRETDADQAAGSPHNGAPPNGVSAGGARPAAMRAGYGLVFGRCERKAISMAVLDLALEAGRDRAEGPGAPVEDEEFVLHHTDGVETSGLLDHLKLPHYVTFQSSLDRLRAEDEG